MRRASIFAALAVAVVVFLALHLARGQQQSANFQIAQHGHPVGTAGYTFKSGLQGYSSASLVQVSMQGLNYALSKDESLTSQHHLRNVSLSATVNGTAVALTGKPEGGEFLLSISASGRTTNTRLPDHAGAVLLSDFDPGALQTLLNLAQQQNNRDLWAIIPKQTGSVAPVQLATYADLQGKLDDKPVTVHHLTATISGSKTELFTDPDNQLLQAELPQAGFALIRNGFVLQPPSHAPAPPPEPQAAPAQNQPTQ